MQYVLFSFVLIEYRLNNSRFLALLLGGMNKP